MKWLKGAKRGTVVVGGQGTGDSLTQLSAPQGVIVDPWSDLYVADCGNNQIMRWSEGSKEGSIVVGGSREFHLYVLDNENARVQNFVENEEKE
jgi:hypothetical protein